MFGSWLVVLIQLLIASVQGAALRVIQSFKG